MTIEAGLPPVTQNTLAYAGPLYGTVPCGWFERDPTTADTDYPGMFVWGNSVNGNLWMRTDTATVWVQLESGSGFIDVNDGGTGRNTLTNHAVLIGAGTNPVNFVGPAAAGTVLQGAGASADPTFSTTTYPATSTKADLIYASANNTFSDLAFVATPTRYLANTGSVGTVPAWDFVNISNGVTGVLDIEHGGTGSAGVMGTAQTTDATPTALISFNCGSVPGTYTFDIRVAGFASVGAGTPLSVGYTIVGSVRTNGSTTATYVNQQSDKFEEIAGCDCTLTVSGNNAVVQITGAALYTITWKGDLIYTFTGA